MAEDLQGERTDPEPHAVGQHGSNTEANWPGEVMVQLLQEPPPDRLSQQQCLGAAGGGSPAVPLDGSLL